MTNQTINFKVKIDFEIDEKEWDESLVKSPFSTAFQMSNYYKPENVALGSKQIFIRVLDDSENIVGQFSGILNFKASGYISNPISKSIINRFHLGSNLVWKHGPIIHDLKNHEKISFLIFESINKLCKKYNIERIKGTTPPLDSNFSKEILDKTNFSVTTWKDYVISLPKEPKLHFDSLNKNIRYDIRKSEKNDLRFEIAKSLDDIKEFGKLKYRDRENPDKIIKNGLNLSSATWEILYKNGIRVAFLAKHKGKLVGGINAVLFNKILSVTTVINSPNKSLQAGSFLTWNSIKWAIENGCNFVDLSGANPSPISEKEKQIDFYKSKWGGQEYPMFIISKVFSKHRTKFGSLLRKL